MNRIDLVSDRDLEVRLAECLRRGQMPDPFLYIGDSGVESWLTLDSSEEFPVATRLADLLIRSIPEITSHVPQTPDVVSLGVGSGEKERAILQALAQSHSPRYFAVDVSGPMVDTALRTASDVPVPKQGIVAFVEDLPLIRSYWTSPVLLCLLGNNFSNYRPEYLLGLVRQQLTQRDLFLFDCHLLPPDGSRGKPGAEVVEEIYGSRQNALFNMGPLIQRGMARDACKFHLDLITVDTSAGPSIRTRKHLDVIRDSVVLCGTSEVHLPRGLRIEMGFTFKHTLEQVRNHLARHGLREVQSFVSQAGDNLLVLAGTTDQEMVHECEC